MPGDVDEDTISWDPMASIQAAQVERDAQRIRDVEAAFVPLDREDLSSEWNEDEESAGTDMPVTELAARTHTAPDAQHEAADAQAFRAEQERDG